MKMLFKGASIAVILHAALQVVSAQDKTLRWLGYREVSLYSSLTVAGPWSLVGTNLLPPYTFATTNKQTYFRAVCTGEFVTLNLPSSVPTNSPYTFVFRDSPTTGMTNIYFTIGVPKTITFLEKVPGTNVYSVYGGYADMSGLTLFGSGSLGNGIGQNVALSIQ